MTRFAVALALLVVVGCSSETAASDVDWSKYPDGTWTRIEGADCREMQDLFNAFDDMDEAIRKQYGEGAGDVLGYLDARMEGRGCY